MEPKETAVRRLGEVVFYTKARGFGFLRDADDRNQYFHISGIADGSFPVAGDLFTYLVRQSQVKKDSTEAYDMVRIKRANKKPAFVSPEVCQ